MVIKLLSLALLGVGVGLFVRTLSEVLIARWNRQIDGYARWMSVEFESMFEDMSVARARRIITISVFGSFVLGFLVAGGLGQRVLLGGVLAIVGYFGPWTVVWHMRKRRIEAIDNQLVDTLQMMANGLRSGFSLQQALELVVREMKPPISDEFGRLVKEIHLGRLTDDALRRLAERVPLEDLQLAVDSVLTLRETGGNLSETFQVIASTIVERKKVYGKIKSMTAQGMTQGVVICIMPIALMLLFTFIDPGYMRPFFTTPLGWAMMLLVFVLDGMGLLLMMKLVKVDV